MINVKLPTVSQQDIQWQRNGFLLCILCTRFKDYMIKLIYNCVAYYAWMIENSYFSLLTIFLMASNYADSLI